ncbi:ComEC/Rec2 family competence protein [Microbulbifer sp. Q7]|uniref:ComEC/Rec2 family competence protein n=1 Tax=Microbulbifer sp. Q7 TaxID=1785091 RepID=UPI00082F21C1|nr:MBL fold metallo-hydrolase [Microbulbifer sp. Q7]
MKLKVLKANNGDAFLISWVFEGKRKNILIDGGKSSTYKRATLKGDLFRTLSKIEEQGERIDLLVLTHVDDDHIGGVLSAFKNNELLRALCDKVWFNSGLLISEHFANEAEPSHELLFEFNSADAHTRSSTSIRQGVSFESIITELGIWHRKIIKSENFYKIYGAKFYILSPTIEKLESLLIKWKKEIPSSFTASRNTDYGNTFTQLLANDKFQGDNSIHNGSSIAILVELESKRLLMLGDAHDETIVNAIKNLKDEKEANYSESNPLKVDYVKLSHHGSRHNTSPQFLKLIESDNFILSTDGSAHSLPHKLTLARIHKQFPNATIWFNYEKIIREIFTVEEQKELVDSGFSLEVIESTIEL